MFSLIHKLIGTCNYRGPECKSSENTYNIYTYNPPIKLKKIEFWWGVGVGCIDVINELKPIFVLVKYEIDSKYQIT